MGDNSVNKGEKLFYLLNRICVPSLHLLISSLTGMASRTLAESLGKHHDSTSVLEALPGNLDIQQAFSIYME